MRYATLLSLLVAGTVVAGCDREPTEPERALIQATPLRQT